MSWETYKKKRKSSLLMRAVFHSNGRMVITAPVIESIDSNIVELLYDKEESCIGFRGAPDDSCIGYNIRILRPGNGYISMHAFLKHYSLPSVIGKTYEVVIKDDIHVIDLNNPIQKPGE